MYTKYLFVLVLVPLSLESVNDDKDVQTETVSLNATPAPYVGEAMQHELVNKALEQWHAFYLGRSSMTELTALNLLQTTGKLLKQLPNHILSDKRLSCLFEQRKNLLDDAPLYKLTPSVTELLETFPQRRYCLSTGLKKQYALVETDSASEDDDSYQPRKLTFEETDESEDSCPLSTKSYQSASPRGFIKNSGHKNEPGSTTISYKISIKEKQSSYELSPGILFAVGFALGVCTYMSVPKVAASLGSSASILS